MEEILNNKGIQIRVCPDFIKLLNEIKDYIHKFTYGVIDSSNIEATQLLVKKIEKYGGIKKFLDKQRIDID